MTQLKNKHIKNNLIRHPLTLKGSNVDLISLDRDHFSQLETAAKDERIWEYYIVNCSRHDKFNETYSEALDERDKGTQFPFVIFHKNDNKIIGSTRFLDIQPANKKLEIGWTWLHPDYWSTSVNTECKLLLLTYCFEELKTVRVQFRTDENNLRSKKAIEKTGGRYEGTLRNDMIRNNGTLRNSLCFSIINTEWTQIKEKLTL